MKKIFFIIGIVLILTSPLFAELYSCKDSKGNAIVTSSPQDGMTDCMIKDSGGEPSAPAEIKQSATYEEREQKQKERFLAREQIEKCKSKCDQEEYKPCKDSCYSSFKWDKNKSKWEDCYKGCKVWLDRCEDKCK